MDLHPFLLSFACKIFITILLHKINLKGEKCRFYFCFEQAEIDYINIKKCSS